MQGQTKVPDFVLKNPKTYSNDSKSSCNFTKTLGCIPIILKKNVKAF